MESTLGVILVCFPLNTAMDQIRKHINIVEMMSPDGTPGIPGRIFTVFYNDGYYDHNLIVRAKTKEQAEHIITHKYVPTLSFPKPRATVMTKEDIQDMGLSEDEFAEMDREGYYLYDHGT